MSDVPLGVFLSGGIDSSAIAAAMAEEVDEPIRSFSINAPNKGYDESAFARAVSSHTGSRHREVRLTAEDWFAAWPRMVFHEDEPIAHPSSISLHFVSQLAAEDVKVVLTGEGADELMAGYERYYQTLYNLQAGRLVPAPLRRLAGRALGLLPERSFVRRKARRTSLVLEPDVDSLLLDNYAAFARPEIAALLRPEYRGAALADLYRPFDALMEASDARELLDRILYADIKTYLLELLMKQDQMSMSASLESRVPFLDHRARRVRRAAARRVQAARFRDEARAAARGRGHAAATDPEAAEDGLPDADARMVPRFAPGGDGGAAAGRRRADQRLLRAGRGAPRAPAARERTPRPRGTDLDARQPRALAADRHRRHAS